MRLDWVLSAVCVWACLGGAHRFSAGTELDKLCSHWRVRIFNPVMRKAIVRNAQKDTCSGLRSTTTFPGATRAFWIRPRKLNAIRAVAEAAHKAKNHAFVYIAGTECITAHADKADHSVVKDHPDWLQRKLAGEPAVFTSGAAFWISPGDEDVWISPYAKDWRKIYMERVRQIAANGH